MMAQRSLNPYRDADQERIISRIRMYQRVRPDIFDPKITVDKKVFDLLATQDTLDSRVSDVVSLANQPGSRVYNQSLADDIQ